MVKADTEGDPDGNPVLVSVSVPVDRDDAERQFERVGVGAPLGENVGVEKSDGDAELASVGSADADTDMLKLLLPQGDALAESDADDEPDAEPDAE